MTAIKAGNLAVVEWLLAQPETWTGRWDNDPFKLLLQHTPSLATHFLDAFAIERGCNDDGDTAFMFSDLRFIYGEPTVKVANTALAIAVRYHRNKNVLSHPIMEHVVQVKWDTFAKQAFKWEFGVYFFLLLSYFIGITFTAANPDWGKWKSRSDHALFGLRVIAWACSSFLIVFVEGKELIGLGPRKYLSSIWNWINMISYGTVIATIAFEFHSKANWTHARRSLTAVILVTLSLNMLQYLKISKKTGLLVVMLGDMARDVVQFFWFYSVFLLGFSGAFYQMFQGQDGYENYPNAFITVLLMLFGQITYDPFQSSRRDTRWWISNILLLIYLVCAVIMLLNILIAMMAGTYANDTTAAPDRVAVCCAESVLRFESWLTNSDRKNQFARLIDASDDGGESTKKQVAAAAVVAPIAAERSVDMPFGVAATDDVVIVDVGNAQDNHALGVVKGMSDFLTQARGQMKRTGPSRQASLLDLHLKAIGVHSLKTSALYKSALALEMRAHSRDEKAIKPLEDGLHRLKGWMRRTEKLTSAEVTAQIDHLAALVNEIPNMIETLLQQKRGEMTLSSSNHTTREYDGAS